MTLVAALVAYAGSADGSYPLAWGPTVYRPPLCHHIQSEVRRMDGPVRMRFHRISRTWSHVSRKIGWCWGLRACPAGISREEALGLPLWIEAVVSFPIGREAPRMNGSRSTGHRQRDGGMYEGYGVQVTGCRQHRPQTKLARSLQVSANA